MLKNNKNQGGTLMSGYCSIMLIPAGKKEVLLQQIANENSLSNFRREDFLDLGNWIGYASSDSYPYPFMNNKQVSKEVNELSEYVPVLCLAQLCDYPGFGISLHDKGELITAYIISDETEESYTSDFDYKLLKILGLDQEVLEQIKKLTQHIANDMEYLYCGFDKLKEILQLEIREKFDQHRTENYPRI